MFQTIRSSIITPVFGRLAGLIFLLSISNTVNASELAEPPAQNSSLKLLSDSVVDPAAHTFTGGRWGICVNGQTYQQEGVVTYNGWQYAAYFGEGGLLCIARRRLPDGEWEIIRFDDYRMEDHNDAHNVAVVGVCPGDGTVHLSFDHHCHPLRYRRSVPGLASDPAAFEWKAEHFGPITDELVEGRPIKGFTYPQFFSTPDRKLQLAYRLGASGGGDWHLAEYAPDTGKWAIVGMLFTREGRYKSSKSRCAYPNQFRYGPDSRLHITWCWREEPALSTNHDLCYAYSDDFGRTWRNNAGKIVAVLAAEKRTAKAISVRTPGIIVAPIPFAWGQMNTTTQSVDSRGRVHVVNWQNPLDAKKGNPDLNAWRYYHYWRDPLGKWHHRILPFHGRKPQIVAAKNGDAYVIYCKGEELDYHGKIAGGKLRISAATEASGWSDWKTAWESDSRFVGEPLLDHPRWNGEEILSIYTQEEPDRAGNPSPLHVIDFQP